MSMWIDRQHGATRRKSKWIGKVPKSNKKQRKQHSNSRENVFRAEKTASKQQIKRILSRENSIQTEKTLSKQKKRLPNEEPSEKSCIRRRLALDFARIQQSWDRTSAARLFSDCYAALSVCINRYNFRHCAEISFKAADTSLKPASLHLKMRKST